MDTLLSGELAAIATAALFAVSTSLFTLASRQVGAPAVNRTRLLVAFGLTLPIHWIVTGSPLPINAPSAGWLWLGLSGVIGYAFGDTCLFRAFVLIGAALSMLMFALAPVLAALLGWAFLGESLKGQEWAGIAVTIAGIAWVVSEPRQDEDAGQARRYLSGVLFGLGGALGQALAMIVAKVGLNEGVPPLSGNVMRLLAGAAVIWAVTLVQGRTKENFALLRQHARAGRRTVLGAAVGPVLGVWLSLVAIERAPVGIATTLMTLTPIFLLPIDRVVFHQPITMRAIAGTLVACAGVALLTL